MTNVYVIDHQDSFVYNLVRYIRLLGHTTTVFPHQKNIIEEILRTPPDALVLSPGPCGPDEAPHSLALINALYPTVPLLGICLGHQIIGHAFGAQVVQAKRPLHGHSTPIFHTQQPIFADLPSPLMMARYHSLVLDPKSLQATPLAITAWSAEQEVMAIEHTQYPIIGLQGHPESICSPQGMALLQACLHQMGLASACKAS